MIRLSREGAVARLLLDRPHARNAIPVDGWGEIANRAREAVEGGARLLVVAGADGAFCAGADLGEFVQMREEEGGPARFRAAMRRGMETLAGLPIPVVAWIEGPCYGAGVALAMACDVRVAAPDARFAITPAKMGISYPQEDVARVVRLVGPGQASRLLFTGLSIDAAEAVCIGLAELAGGEAELEALVAAMLACDAGSLRVLKRGIAAAAPISADSEQDRLFDALIGAPEFGRRLEALRRK